MKESKGSRIVTVITFIAIVIVGFFLYREVTGGAGTSTAQGALDGRPGRQVAVARNPTSVRVTPVVLGTIENSIIINGDVLTSTQVSIYPAVAGIITETRFSVGDRVSQGAVMAMVDPSRPGEAFSQSAVTSTISGTVIHAPVNTGDTVSANTIIYLVGDLSSLIVETFVPERFSNFVQRGLAAQVFLEALPGETFQAVVNEISPVLDPVSRSLRIRLRFSGPADSRIKAGMFATVRLVTNVRRDVPIIPRAAMIDSYGSWIVFVVDEQNIAQCREIHLGLENEEFVEVIDGLSPSDRVVSAGQHFLTHGELVRIVE
ncbi:MAG: efflux RND transporter periplasmic adaptor subunit [Treponema sp.]|nr:efflux RND transporter periplasmic adaptor subunit [Treponema sp.]